MNGEDDVHYLYVIQFSDGAVKVGQTRHVRERLKHHEYEARLADRTVEEFDFSFRYSNALAEERRLIAFCAARWTAEPGRREYFADADFEALCSYFQQLERLASQAGWHAAA